MTPRDPVGDAFEPYEPRRRVPLPFYWIAIALAIWGALALLRDKAADRAGAQRRQAVAQAAERRESATGSALFFQRCSTCHQADGSGVSGAIPPLRGSLFLDAQPEVLVQILLHGIEGPIRVGDVVYSGHMPAFGSVLTNDQMARLATAVRTTWGAHGSIDASFVAAQRSATASRTYPWRGGEEITKVLDQAVGSQPSYVRRPVVIVDATAARIAIRGKDGGWACASCHGTGGEGRGAVPRLAGLPADYIAKQLSAFSSGKRPNDIMRPVAQQLTPAEMTTLGNFYAALASPSRSRPSLDGDLARGVTLALQGDDGRAIPSCFSCHGASGFGIAPAIPAIAAQQPSYTASRLATFARRPRSNPGAVMSAVASRLSDADRRAVADYLATLPPTPATVTLGNM